MIRTEVCARKKIHAGGMKDGEQVIELLVHHPRPAKSFPRKLARRFVSDNPPPSLVNRMAETFKSAMATFVQC